MIRRLAAIVALLLTATPAAAHTGPHADGFINGFAHPVVGIDHLLAMVAVGLWAAQLGGVARWAMPASFVVSRRWSRSSATHTCSTHEVVDRTVPPQSMKSFRTFPTSVMW